ncbi:patatin-like phospholipase family protein [Paenibacillus eucommiae]|nr:patatin family protein [Paenibacillus eucommiae]
MDIGLLLEGGGMRGIYTAGVLDYWMKRELHFPYMIGVSSGAWHATNYISRQPGRAKSITIDLAKDHRAISYRNWILKGSVFGFEFLFDKVPNELYPFDYTKYFQSEEQLTFVLTDPHTGKAVYYTKEDTPDQETLKQQLTAAISLPYVAKPAQWLGKTLFDGGVAEPLPLQKAIDDGYGKLVVLLVKEKGYRKKRSRLDLPARWVYSKYPLFVESIMQRYVRYNKIIDEMERLEAEGRLFILRPSVMIGLDRMGRNPVELEQMYKMGYSDAEQSYDALERWMSR